MHKEVYGHGKGKVKSIPNAYWGIGKPVPQKVRKENSHNDTLCKITRPVRLRSRLGIGQ